MTQNNVEPTKTFPTAAESPHDQKSMGRLVFLCGTAGAGKTTVAENLKKAGWVHFCIDAWQNDLDPIERSGQLPSVEEQKQVSPEKQALWTDLATNFYVKWLNGEAPTYTAWSNFYEAAMADATQLHHCKYSKQDFVISHAALTREIRDYVRARLVPQAKMIVLDTPKELLVAWKVKRLAQVAADQSMTVQEFMHNFKDQNPSIPGQGETYEEMLAFHTELPSKECEPVGLDEPSTFSVQVREGMSPDDVTTATLRMLGNADPR